MPETIETELVVLGAGPGGYAAAFLAADKGMKVTLIDAGEKPGGTCLHVGCIPSKALLHAAKLITDAREAAHFGLHFDPPKIDLDGVRGQGKRSSTRCPTNLARACARRRKVEFVHARAPLRRRQHRAARRRPPRPLPATASSPPAPSRCSRRRCRLEQPARHGLDRRPCSWRKCRRRCWSSAAATSAWSWATSTPPWAARSPSSS